MEKIKPLLFIFAILATIYVGIKVIPPLFNDWQFQDFIESEARIDTYNTKPEADIRKDVMKAARENDIPISDDQLEVQRCNGSIYIGTKYIVHVDLPVYPLDLKFNPSSKNVNPVVR
jgi:hypothetical protein